MTQRITEKNVYFYYKLLVAKTGLKYKLLQYGEDTNRWCLELKFKNRGFIPVSRHLSTIEIYEVLLSMVNNLDHLDNEYMTVEKLNEKETKYLNDNLHNEDIIRVVEE